MYQYTVNIFALKTKGGNCATVVIYRERILLFSFLLLGSIKITANSLLS